MEYSNYNEYDNPPRVITGEPLFTAEPHQENKENKPATSKKNSMNMRDILGAAKLDKDNRMDSVHFLFEITMYIFYLVILVYIAFAYSSSQKFFFSKAIGNAFVTSKQEGISFSEVKDINNIWNYLSKVLIRGLYRDNIVYNMSSEDSMILYENKLLGQPMLRMLKVHNKSCTVPESFAREIKQCFANYNAKNEDKQTFGNDKLKFEWKSAKSLGTKSIQGTLANYEGSGYVVLLPKDDPVEADLIISQLKNMRFIDRGTRAIIIDFALFNGNVNLFTIARLLFELPATGGVMTTPNFYTYSLFRYNGSQGFVLIAFEGLFVGFTLFLLIEEIIEIFRIKMKYFISFWNIVDMIILGLSIAAIIVSYSRTNTVSSRLNLIVQSNLSSATMDDVVVAENSYHHIVSLILFLSFIKVFKYISVNRTMSQLSDTLSRSSKDIGGFFVMFSVFFFAYAQFGYLVFGTQIEDYSTFLSAVFALLRTILGDFDYLALERANRYLGPAFFLSYVFFVFFVLLNMFLAIINDSYVQVKAELEKKKKKESLFDWINAKLNRLMNSKARSGRPDSPDDINITYDVYKTELVRAGFKEKDINDAFTKFDIKSYDPLDEKTMDKISTEMRNQLDRRNHLDENHRNYIIVNRRVDALQEALSTSVKRFETVMQKMADIEEKKALEKENENKLLIQNFLNNTSS